MPALSVIIPVGPGDTSWRGLLPQLDSLIDIAELALVAARGIDLVPGDDPGAKAAMRPRRLLTPAGRALQLNAGARAASGTWLWFLHGDTRLAPASLPALRRALAGDADAVHYFQLRFLRDGPPWMPLNALGARLRCRCFGLPFGDQGLLLRAASFQRLGGFDETLPHGEDHALIWAAHRSGLPVRAIGAPLYTSARKYAERGWLATTARHLRLTWQQARVESKRLPRTP